MSNVDIDVRTVRCGSGMPVTVYVPCGTREAVPGVVLMHERYGLVQNTSDLAGRIAAEGYCVATPDLFFYMEDQKALHAGSAKASPSDPYVIDRLDEVVSVLSGEPVCDSSTLGMIGVCQTGRYSIIYGCKRPLGACAVLYGAVSDWDKSERRPEGMAGLIKDLGAPFLGLYGEIDHSISIPDVLRLRRVLEENDKSYRIRIFKDAPHGWLNSTMPGRFRAHAAESAIREIAGFLDRCFTPASEIASRAVWEFESNKGRDYVFRKNVRFE